MMQCVTINRLDPFVIHRPVSGQGVQQTCIEFTGNAQASVHIVDDCSIRWFNIHCTPSTRNDLLVDNS